MLNDWTNGQYYATSECQMTGTLVTSSRVIMQASSETQNIGTAELSVHVSCRGHIEDCQEHNMKEEFCVASTGIMTDTETPLAKIVGQISLSKSTDVSTQSWVFIM